MLSYRHAFHAGNHADVLKHFVFRQVIQYFNQKDKPYWVIDTHAGAGMYSLDTGYAAQNAEYETGIGKLWHEKSLPSDLKEYVDFIYSLNPQGKLQFYPGSPACAETLMRGDDKLRLFELHPNDFKLLARNYPLGNKRIMLKQESGFDGLKALLPPPSRRGIVLIDPPYEEKQDYQRVIEALKDSLQRFSTGTYILWYPLLQRSEIKTLQDNLSKLEVPSWLSVTLSIDAPSIDGFGMHGSGLFIINPPWTLPKILHETLPALNLLLGVSKGANYTLHHQIP